MLKDNRAVFGLDSVKIFFAVILGIALLAYVIVVIMGTLNNSTILPGKTLSGTSVNESGYLNDTGYSLTYKTLEGFTPTLVYIQNASQTVVLANASVTNGIVKNTTAMTWNLVNYTYTYTYDDTNVIGARNILKNTSTGVTGFFANISPAYAILAILVIILILVVLVRVVSSSTGSSQASSGSVL